jgi:large-conductance mechanosensitive channel
MMSLCLPLDFSSEAWTLKTYRLFLGLVGLAGVPAVAIRYGQFINALLQFLIVGLTVFVVIQTIRKMAEFDARYLEKAISAFGGVAQEKSQEGPPPAPMS